MSLSQAVAAVSHTDGLCQVRPVSCFSVIADADPGVLPRVLGVFAKRGLVPCQCYATIAGAAGCDLHIDLQVAGVGPALREILAETLRQIVAVDTVLTSDRAVARPA